MTTSEQRSANEMAAERTDLATIRTLMGADRTLMAWVRTALAMISFGFTLYKFLEGMRASGEATVRASPRAIGLFLVGLGTLSMLAGLLEYRQTLLDLGVTKRAIRRPAFAIALIMAAMGTLMFVSVIVRLL
jgi:putative membrane protein